MSESKPQSRDKKCIWKDESTLRYLYGKKGYSLRKVAKMAGCSYTTVSSWIDKYGIQKRDLSGQYRDEKPWRDEETLKILYIDGGMYSQEIAEEFGCADSTIHYWLDKFGIDTPNGRPCRNELLESGGYLYKLYVEDGLSSPKIANKVGTTPYTVRYWLKKHGIEIRDRSEAAQMAFSVEYEELGSEEYLREKYVESGLSTTAIAKEIGCSAMGVWQALKRNGIETKGQGEATPTGENHYRWSGGEMPYGSGWNKETREAVRESQDRRCAGCSMAEHDHIQNHCQKLHVHHIQKARTIDNPEIRNSAENLVALCRDCHKHWEAMSPLKPDIGRDMGAGDV